MLIPYTIAASRLAPNLYGHIEIALLRVPAFLIGMDCGKLAVERRDPPTWAVALTLLALPVKLASLTHGVTFQRIANVLYAAVLIEAVVLVYRAAEDHVRLPHLRSLLDSAGRCSFELYLTHVLLRNYMETVGVNIVSVPNYLLCMVISIPAALLLEKVRPGRRPT